MSYEYVRLGDIRYSQDSIGNTFRDGRSLNTLVRQLRQGVVSLDEVPTIRVYRTRKGNLQSHDHRRLWCFNKVFPANTYVEVIITDEHVPDKKYCGFPGKSAIDVRGGYDDEFECPSCNKTFGSAHALQQHKNSFSCGPECRICDRSFRSWQALDQHRNSGSCGVKGGMECPICGRDNFKSGHGVVQHVESGRCPHCPGGRDEAASLIYNFTKKNAPTLLAPMIEDIQIGGGRSNYVPDGAYSCHQCGRIFNKMSQLMQHSRDKHGQAEVRLRLGY